MVCVLSCLNLPGLTKCEAFRLYFYAGVRQLSVGQCFIFFEVLWLSLFVPENSSLMISMVFLSSAGLLKHF